MFSTKTLVAFLVFATPFLVRADAVPVTPAPGDIFVEGSMCTLAWTGDTSSTSLWKNMAIELMAGSNEDMEFITSNYHPFFFFSIKAKFFFSLL